jgi:hypothetical protein
MMIKQGMIALGVILAAASPLYAQTSGKAAYDELCLSCHKQPQRLAVRVAKTDEARAKLDVFLVKHYAPDEVKRAAVLEFIYSLK